MKFPNNIPVYGDKSFRGKCPSEDREQVTFFNKLRREYPELGAIAIHIKNEGKRKHNQAARDKMEGMVTGASDIIIPGKSTFVCEMKRQDHTKSNISQEQINYLHAAQEQGAFACIALGYEGAFLGLEKWLEGLGRWTDI